MRWLMEEPDYGRSPQICVDALGRCWTAWISCGVVGECVRGCYLREDDQWSRAQSYTSVSKLVTALTLAPWGDGVLLAWIDGDDPKTDGLKMRWCGPSSRGRELLVVPLANSPAHASLTASDGHFALVYSELGNRSRRIIARVGDEPHLRPRALVVFEDDGSVVRPAVAMAGEAVAVARQSISNEASSIEIRFIDEKLGLSERTLVATNRGGLLAMPSICPSGKDGFWIAWQSNLDAEIGSGLVRWIDVVHSDLEGVLGQPEEPMPGVDRQARGVDQGFESPSIVCPHDGRLVIIGRGSQSLNRQDLGTEGWSERVQIDGTGWGCRGRCFSVCAVGDYLLVAGREQAGVTVRRLPVDTGTGGGHPGLASLKTSISDVSEFREKDSFQHIIAGRRVLFGDLHQHTLASDGTGTIEEALQRCRYFYKDEISAVSDHESFLGKRTTEGEWAESCRIVDELYSPGSFVTLHAFEWTGSMFPGPGHKVVYLPAQGGPVLSRDDEATSASFGLLEASRKIGAVVVPHHVGWTGADAEHHDPAVQPCFEIVSCHGAYERPGFEIIGTRGDDKEGQFVGEVLDQGLRFGFMGGSDGHGLNWHHGVCRKEDSHRTGLTAVFSNEVTREGVLDALRRRRCYATSGAKIGLWFEIDGRPMGEELVLASPVPCRIVVAATCEIDSLAIVTNGGRELAMDVSGVDADIWGTINPPPEGSFCYYYVRVVQKDKEVAWSSPIWLDAPSPA